MMDKKSNDNKSEDGALSPCTASPCSAGPRHEDECPKSNTNEKANTLLYAMTGDSGAQKTDASWGVDKNAHLLRSRGTDVSPGAANGVAECNVDLLEKVEKTSDDSQTVSRTQAGIGTSVFANSNPSGETPACGPGKVESMLFDEANAVGDEENAANIVSRNHLAENSTPENPRKRVVILFAIPFFSGMINSFQAGLLGIVGKIYDPIFALWVNMTFAWILWENSIHVLKINQRFFKERPMEKREPFAWWKVVVGGWFGNIGIPLTSLCIPKIGFIKFFVAFIVGQIAGSLLVDRTGFGGMVKRKICIPQKILALFFIAIGVGLVTSGHEDSSSSTEEDDDEDLMTTVCFSLLSILTGLTLPTQAAVNGAASRTSAYPTFGVLCSYRSAFLTATLLMLISRIYLKLTDSDDLGSTDFLRLNNPTVVEGVNDDGGHPPFYYFLYGVIGKIHIFVLMFISQKIGVTPTILLVLLGQLTASLPLDVTGGFGMGMTKRVITDLKAIGIVFTAIGVICNVFVEDDTNNAITDNKVLNDASTKKQIRHNSPIKKVLKKGKTMLYHA